jgi:hypothetical protein
MANSEDSVSVSINPVDVGCSVSVKYLHRSNKKKDQVVRISFTVAEHIRSDWDCELKCYIRNKFQLLILSTDSWKQCGSRPSILDVIEPGKIISLTMIQISASSVCNNEMYNLLVFYTKGEEKNLFLNVYHISYDRCSILQPAGYHRGNYRCVDLILTLPVIFNPDVHFAQVSFPSLSRTFPLQPFKNMTFLSCYKRVMLRLKTYNKFMSLLIRRLFTTYESVRHHQKVYNKIELFMMSRVFTTYFKSHCFLHTDSEDESIPSLHLFWSETQNNLIGYRKINPF